MTSLEDGAHVSATFQLRAKRRATFVRPLAVALFLVLGANIFQFFPMLEYLREGWYVISFFYCGLFSFFAQLTRRDCRLSGYEVYVAAVIAIMPFVSALSAHSVFGQPLLPGILTHRAMATYAAGIALLYWLRTDTITVHDLERALVLAGWGSLALYMTMYFFMKPSHFAGARGFVAGGVVEPYHFIFKSPFIAFLAIYYLVRAFSRQSFLYLVLLLPLLFFLLFIDGGRSQFLSLMVAMAVLLVVRMPVLRLLSVGLPFGLLLAAALGVTHYFFPDAVEGQAEKFYAAVYVVLTGQESSDSSANARLREQKLAMPYIKENIVFGNGQLSAQWQSGYIGQLGYFAPSDIGILGLVFVFGLFGAVVLYLQFAFAFFAHRRILASIRLGARADSDLRVALSTFIFFLFVDSLATGRVVFAGSVSFLFIAMLYAFFIPLERQKKRLRKRGIPDNFVTDS